MLGVAESNYCFPSNDPPDAVIKQGIRKISLEHMRFTVEKEREQESIRRECVSRARSNFISLNTGLNISASVIFDFSDIKSTMIDKYAASICSGVLRFSDTLLDMKSRHEYEKFTLYLSVVQDPAHARWQCVNNSIGWVKKVREEALAERLSRKDAGLRKYRREYDESWLLIFVDKTKGSSMFTLSEFPAHATMFDKVFVATDQDYIELQHANTTDKPSR